MRRAFTLLEVVIAVAIILVLISLLLYSMGWFTATQQKADTRTSMELLQTMLSEYGQKGYAVTPLPTQPIPSGWLPGNLRLEAAEVAGPANPNGRYGRCTVYTRGIMARLMQQSTVRKMADGLSLNRAMQIPPAVDLYAGIATYPLPTPNPFPIGVADLFYGEPGTTNARYIAATSHDGAQFFAESAPRSGSRAGEWWLDLSGATTTLLDGWGNPILFFPSCGFVATFNDGSTRLVTSKGELALSRPLVWTSGVQYTADRDYVIFSGLLLNYPNPYWHIYRATRTHTAQHTGSANDNDPNMGTHWTLIGTKPFFASAGPDGIFFDPANSEVMRDNVYSFGEVTAY